MRGRLEVALRAGKVNIKESALLLKRYEEGLAAYTYLADDDLEDNGADQVVLPAAQPAEQPQLQDSPTRQT
jgi:hypothetical protein